MYWNIRHTTPLVLAVCILAGLVGCTSTQQRWLDNPLDAADQTFRWADLKSWETADGVPDTISFTSEVQACAFGFTELLPSWNPRGVSAGEGLTLWVRSRDQQSRQWSPWLYLGRWGDAAAPAPPSREVRFEHGRVAVDLLELDRPADAFQVQVRSVSGRKPLGIPLTRIAVVVSGPGERASARHVAPLTASDRDLVRRGAWRRDLPVPFLPQKMLPRPLWSRGCSPTATTMVLQYRGRADATPTRTAEAVYDAEHDIYGNWGRAVAYAGSLGLDAELARFRTWDQLKAAIARGQPVIASIRFGPGEFPSNPMSDTAGHLIVIRGLTAGGDAIVNDSALGQEGDGIVYKAEELARAWLGKGGVGYVIGGAAE